MIKEKKGNISKVGLSCFIHSYVCPNLRLSFNQQKQNMKKKIKKYQIH